MSDDSNDNPPSKLKLSRDLKDQGEPEAVKAPPSMKLKRTAQTEETPAQAPAQAPSGNAVPPEAPVKKPGFDPKNPFGDVIKEGEIQKPSSPPPELLSKPAPKVDDGSAAKIEEAINTLDAEEAKAAGKGGLMLSIIVILILLLVVGGAGYGLWKVLKPVESTENTAATVTDEAAAAQKSKNPIEKAKDAIAKGPLADVEAITETTPSAEPAKVPTETPVATQATIAAVPQSTPNAAPSTLESNKQSASVYLSAIHIGGVRKGDRPMILIEGERFLVGDVVHAETGLKFDGIREGRLAFRDSHGIVYLKSF